MARSGVQPLFTLTLTTPGSDQLPVVRALAFSSTGQLLATGDVQGTVRIVGTTRGPRSGPFLATVSDRPALHLMLCFPWATADLRSLTTVQTWQTRSPGILGTHFAANDTDVRCIGADGKVQDVNGPSLVAARVRVRGQGLGREGGKDGGCAVRTGTRLVPGRSCCWTLALMHGCGREV